MYVQKSSDIDRVNFLHAWPSTGKNFVLHVLRERGDTVNEYRKHLLIHTLFEVKKVLQLYDDTQEIRALIGGHTFSNSGGSHTIQNCTS